MSELAHIATSARDWLFAAALPFWSTRGVDPIAGGFHDLVGPDGSPVPCVKRAFVQARQVFSFVEAGRLGWSGPWQELVELGLQVLDQNCRSPEGGFVHSLRADLGVHEPRRALYDQAFIAFASARAGAALGRESLVEKGRQIFAMLETDWASNGAGFREGEMDPQPPRRQNPHMHLVEAAWALATAPGATVADHERMNRCAGLIDLFADQNRSILPELFDEGWQPLADHLTWIEPGHHFEWFWLLERVRAAGGLDRTALGLDLWRFGIEHGIDPVRNVAIDELHPDGRTRSAMARLWPQTERLKGAIAAYRLSRGREGSSAVVAAYHGLQPYLETPMPGAFFDKMRSDGSFVAEPARASSLYHVICAYGELFNLVDEAA